MIKIKTAEELAGDEMCSYCSYTRQGHTNDIFGMCEGRFCTEAYETYVEENTPESKEDMQENQTLCEYCLYTDRGVEEVSSGARSDGSGQLISCEGAWCEDAYAYYLVEFEEENN